MKHRCSESDKFFKTFRTSDNGVIVNGTGEFTRGNAKCSDSRTVYGNDQFYRTRKEYFQSELLLNKVDKLFHVISIDLRGKNNQVNILLLSVDIV